MSLSKHVFQITCYIPVIMCWMLVKLPYVLCLFVCLFVCLLVCLFVCFSLASEPLHVVTGMNMWVNVLSTMMHSLCFCHLAVKMCCIVYYLRVSLGVKYTPRIPLTFAKSTNCYHTTEFLLLPCRQAAELSARHFGKGKLYCG